MTLWSNRKVKIPRTREYQWKLDESGTTILDSNGAGTIQFAPGGAREKWSINFVAVNCQIPDDSYLVPTMILYRASAVPGNQLGGTFSATMDADSTTVYNLNMNEPVVCVFSNGPPGAQAYVHIEGIRYVWE